MNLWDEVLQCTHLELKPPELNSVPHIVMTTGSRLKRMFAVMFF